ncbi:hypothetical protein [Pseudomonas fluorescens]|uniref:Uncharacterized protein n=1 Tax=Pseudomonas fluorescens TaxID=294 RepID=A0A5E7H598_PSEFL|nr:hypothetical protein [Pseudomonas fluorescens]VVO59135.1 hypothetical protein PS880_00706 [Pseudomonas fluorescens]
MAKPPKKVPTPPPPDTSLTQPKTSSGEDAIKGDHHTHPRLNLSDGEPDSNLHVFTTAPNAIPHQQPLVVTDMPVSAPFTPPGDLVSWPRDQIDQLIQIGDSGLFMSNEQKLYADIENAGIGRVELNANGDYQVHFPFAPDHPGPILKKIPGKAQWRFAEHWPAPQAEGSNTSTPDLDARVALINPTAVKKIPEANDFGIRWHNLRSYVDLINEGTVQVGKDENGDYQATTPQEWTPSGPVLERIGVTRFWKRKSASSRSQEQQQTPEHSLSSEDVGPGPAKRIRTEESSAVSSDINPYLWAAWGKIVKPEAVESVQIAQLHYQVVPQGRFLYPLVTYLQHPEFPPSRFEAFEKMLNESPWLQPVPAIRDSTSSPWSVQGNTRQFDRPITQAVMDSFKDFSVHTSRAIAKRLFERSGHSEVIIQDGLSATAVTLRHWKGQSVLSVPELENPLNLLPVAPRTGPSGQTISTLPPAPGDPLLRLDFNLQRYQVEWTRFLSLQSDYNLKYLLNSVLTNNGYDVFPFTNEQRDSVLVFKRANHDKVYFLKLGFAKGNHIELKTKPPELSDPRLISKVGDNAYQALMTANAQQKIVWLVGGAQSTASGWQSVFIMRER